MRSATIFNDFRRYFTAHGEPLHENPSPGNIAGGITTLEEKSLGAVQKGGRAAVTSALRYGEQVRERGLAILEAPGNDAVSSTALAAAGANIILFTTGRGTPLGFPVPTLKIASNAELARRKPSLDRFRRECRARCRGSRWRHRVAAAAGLRYRVRSAGSQRDQRRARDRNLEERRDAVMPRLAQGTLAGLPPAIRRPAYELERHPAGHPAFRSRRVSSRAPGLVRRPAAAAAIRAGASPACPCTARTCAMHCSRRTGSTRWRYRTRRRRIAVIGSLRELIVATDDPAAVVRRLADTRLAVVTLTVTEKGYCLATDGTLDAIAPGRRARPGHAQCAGQRPRLHRRRTAPAARAGAIGAGHRQLRQRRRERAAVARGGHRAGATAGSVARAVDRGRGSIPVHDGRQHLSCDHRRIAHARYRPRSACTMPGPCSARPSCSG